MTQSFFSRLFGAGADRDACGEVLRIPGDLRDPPAVAVVQGSRPGDIWAALFVLRNAALTWPSAELVLLVREEDREIVQLSSMTPATWCIPPGGRIPDAPGLPGGALAILASAGTDHGRCDPLRIGGALVRAALGGTPSANVRVLPGGRAMPESIHFLCEQIGMQADRSWRPSALKDDVATARSILSPSTGAPTPYIVGGARAIRVLERAGAEIPLKVIPASGRESPLASSGRAVQAAIVAGATVVAADAPWLWAEAIALGVPAAGLDRSGSFPLWEGPPPSRNDSDFVASWTEQLRIGLGAAASR